MSALVQLKRVTFLSSVKPNDFTASTNASSVPNREVTSAICRVPLRISMPDIDEVEEDLPLLEDPAGFAHASHPVRAHQTQAANHHIDRLTCTILVSKTLFRGIGGSSSAPSSTRQRHMSEEVCLDDPAFGRRDEIVTQHDLPLRDESFGQSRLAASEIDNDCPMWQRLEEGENVVERRRGPSGRQRSMGHVILSLSL